MNKRHGMYGTPTYKSWSEMKQRCKNPKHSNSNCYVGITYCNEWEDFKNFFIDMGVRPRGTSLDRINGKGNYCPENCRWATDEEQQNNRENNRFYNYEGQVLTLSQIARKYGISRSNLANKIYLKRMNINDAVDFLRGGDNHRRAPDVC
jgi:hypothetical protein